MNAEPAGALQGSLPEIALADIIQWSSTAIESSLLEGAQLDGRSFVPFVSPETRWFYWELHFSETRPIRVDFLHRPSLVTSRANSAFTSPDPILRQLVDWYATSDTSLHCHDSAWLELDGPLRSEREILQGVSICLEPDIGRRVPGAPRNRWSTPTVVDTFRRLQRSCGVAQQGAETLATVHRALDATGGSTRHLSVMRGRPGTPAKIYAALPKGRLAELLSAIAWPGPHDAALQLADLACADSQLANVDLSFEDALLPRIAYEHFFDPSPAHDPARRRATSLAESLGLLSKAQANALGRWAGSFRLSFDGNTSETKVFRWFDLKFVLSPEGLEFKAYLGFRL